jgi:hypothetical protein
MLSGCVPWGLMPPSAIKPARFGAAEPGRRWQARLEYRSRPPGQRFPPIWSLRMPPGVHRSARQRPPIAGATPAGADIRPAHGVHPPRHHRCRRPAELARATGAGEPDRRAMAMRPRKRALFRTARRARQNSSTRSGTLSSAAMASVVGASPIVSFSHTAFIRSP